MQSRNEDEKTPKVGALNQRVANVIEFFRGRARGGDNCTSLFQCSRPFIQSVKSTLSHLKSCNPVGGTRLIMGHTVKPLPKNVFGPPHLRYVFRTPVLATLCHYP